MLDACSCSYEGLGRAPRGGGGRGGGSRPRPRPRPRPHRSYGPYYGGVVYDYPEQTFIVDRPDPALPWRVVMTNSWGVTVVSRNRTMQAALAVFRGQRLVGFNEHLELQRWTGDGWKTEADRYSGRPGLGSLESFGAASDSEFEALNNAIVSASTRGESWRVLADDWQSRAVEGHAWKMAIPPLWAALMEEFWNMYALNYSNEPNKSGIANPGAVMPSGITGALRDLWAPTVSAAQQASAAAQAVLQQAKAAATAKVDAALQAAGKSLAKGAAEESQKQTVNWGVVLASVGALSVLGYLALVGRQGKLFSPLHT